MFRLVSNNGDVFVDILILTRSEFYIPHSEENTFMQSCMLY